ncbi:hypothetical protein AAHA92_09778 [Salvia divinorum]|uniref:Secreted protein n=1 Tax=Salvia divinorum TaxID=28513 RepID=A0ABD1HW06_SALDI
MSIHVRILLQLTVLFDVGTKQNLHWVACSLVCLCRGPGGSDFAAHDEIELLLFRSFGVVEYVVMIHAYELLVLILSSMLMR